MLETELADVGPFRGMSPERLHWIAQRAVEVALRRGETLYSDGDTAEHYHVLLDGELAVIKRVNGQEITAGRHENGDSFGEIQLLSGEPLPVTLRATRASRLVRLDADVFSRLMGESQTFRREVFDAMLRRARGLERTLRQREKMAALGSLSAGLAHELNNPAAAVARAADGLADGAQRAYAALADFIRAGGDFDLAERLRASAPDPACTICCLDGPAAAMAREDAMIDWLEARPVADAERLAGEFADAGWTADDLDRVAAEVAAPLLGAALAFSLADFDMRKLGAETARASRRISELVGAIKSYSYMEQAAQQDVDIHDGIEDTLIILGHRLKSGPRVERAFDRSLPKLSVYGSELNQVWTNLIDNAIDALEETEREDPLIRIQTLRENDWAVVEVIDNGPGVPEEVKSRIFEPFFTLKPVGRGTGLGLDIAFRIVTHRHRGQLNVDSRPGETRFIVRLPLNAAAA